MEVIDLTRGHTAFVDDSDFELVNNYGWCVIKGGGYKQRLYAQSNIKIDGEWKRVLMHRFILDIWDSRRVDHIDSNGLNNQRSNLRIATLGQNQYNSGSRKGGSKFKGVSWSKGMKRWRAQIMANLIHYELGYFDSELNAALAYDEAARRLHGQFAKTNF